MMSIKSSLLAVITRQGLIGNFRLGIFALVLLSSLLSACGGGASGSSAAGAGGSAGSRVTSAASAPPAAPTGLNITSGNGEVTLSWNPVVGATSYNVYYLTYPGVTTVNSRQLTSAVIGNPITGLTNTVPYYFVVTAVSGTGESAASSEVSAMPMPALPGIPGNVHLVGGFAQATLTWQTVPYATSYNVYYSTSPGITTSNAQSFKNIHLSSQKITGLSIAPGHYYFRVSATDASGEGPLSVELAAVAKSTYRALAAGMGHSAAVKILDAPLANTAGTVWEWGDNSKGQLGVGTFASPRLTAVEVPSLMKVNGIAAGYHHTVALLTDSSVMTWGYNLEGQLGVNGQLLTSMNSNVPMNVGLAPAAMTAVAAGYQHTVALKSDGTVWAWGYNLLGALGYSSLDCQNPQANQYFWTCSDYPTQLGGITGSVTAIAGGFDHTLAVTSGGQVWSWGRNDTGQLGTIGVSCNKSITQMTPTAITALQTTLNALFLTGLTLTSGATFNLADSSCNTTPVPVNAIPGVITAVSAGTRHSVALMSDGTVWTWGGNYYGQLGYTPAVGASGAPILCYITTSMYMPCSYDPKQVQGLDHVVAISAGSDHTLALKNDGTVWAWGYNNNGQLGNGIANALEAPNQTPVQVVDPTDPTGFLTGITAIAAGAYHSLALKNNGTAWAWGDNSQGQLGNNTLGGHSATPVQVQGLLDPVVIIPGR